MGDISITPNSTLRDLIAIGTKYGDPSKVNWNKNTTLALEPVNNYALQKAKRAVVGLLVLPSRAVAER